METILKPDEIVINQIYYIRNQNVMLDRELAVLYQVSTGALNQVVMKNMKRFPEDFMFQLSEKEWSNLKLQIVITSWGGTRKLPYEITEQGVAMLSGILNSDRAIAVNIQIIRIFIRIRKIIIDNTDLRLEIEKSRTN